MRGLFVTFEGIDRSGKTTQAGLLWTPWGRTRSACASRAGRRPASGFATILKDPEVALAPETEALLFAAARSELVADVVFARSGQLGRWWCQTAFSTRPWPTRAARAGSASTRCERVEFSSPPAG